MPKGIYKHKSNQGFQKGHTINKGEKRPYVIGRTAWNKGKKGILTGPRSHHWWKMSKEEIEKLGERMRGNKYSLGLIHTLEHTQKIIKTNSGDKCYNWIKDRTKVIQSDRNLHDPEYKQWRKKVCNRDHWKCKINNSDCEGRLEAHHILGWKKYPELRYNINNGITLCHAHHPRKRSEEARLSPYFQELVAEMNNLE